MIGRTCRRTPYAAGWMSVAAAIAAAGYLVLGDIRSAVAQPRALDVPYVPTPENIVEAMLRLAQPTKEDFLVDLGCGDGRIVITAAQKYGVRGFGVDLNPVRIKEARANALKAKVTDRVEFIEGDLFKTDFTKASVLTLYLLPQVNMALRPQILEMKPGTRVVSHAFDMEDWVADVKEEHGFRVVYHWVVPGKAAGRWAGTHGTGQAGVGFRAEVSDRHGDSVSRRQAGPDRQRPYHRRADRVRPRHAGRKIHSACWKNSRQGHLRQRLASSCPVTEGLIFALQQISARSKAFGAMLTAFIVSTVTSPLPPSIQQRDPMTTLVSRRALVRGLSAGVLVAAFASAPLGAAFAQDGPPRPLDVPYVPTPQNVVDTMLKVAGVKRSDFLIDLGCGDGRIPVTAATRFGTRGFGVDLNPVRVKEAKANVAKNNVGNLVDIVQGDLFETDINKATVISMYLLPSVNLKLRPYVLNLKPGTRIVSHDFDMGDWKADKIEKLDYKTVYFWVVPSKVAGNYSVSAGRQKFDLKLEQKYQEVTGTAKIGGKDVAITNGKLVGANLSFELPMADGRLRKFEGNAYDLGKIGGKDWFAQRI